ncbi:hypothetical protein ACFX13_040484 [Malus domestica]
MHIQQPIQQILSESPAIYYNTEFKKIHQQDISVPVSSAHGCNHWASRFPSIQGSPRADRSIGQKRVLKFFLPQVEAASLLSIVLAFAWQKAVRLWPKFFCSFHTMDHFCHFSVCRNSANLLPKAPTDGIAVCFIAFAIGYGLYACWITQQIGFCSKILIKSLEPVSKFPI